METKQLFLGGGCYFDVERWTPISPPLSVSLYYPTRKGYEEVRIDRETAQKIVDFLTDAHGLASSGWRAGAALTAEEET